MSEIADDGILSISDAAEIGFKVVEMADRLRDVDAALPGSQARIGIEIDGRRFLILLQVDRDSIPVAGIPLRGGPSAF